MLVIELIQETSFFSIALVTGVLEDPDILGQMREAFDNFIESGQVWALGIGFVLGYLFRAFSAY